MAEIKQLREGNIAVGMPDPKIIEWLEALLEDAKRGDIRAFAVVAMKEPDVRKWWFTAHPPMGNALLGAVHRLARRLAMETDELEDDL